MENVKEAPILILPCGHKTPYPFTRKGQTRVAECEMGHRWKLVHKGERIDADRMEDGKENEDGGNVPGGVSAEKPNQEKHP